MKKYRLSQLDIQVTRKCNLYCNHCMRGDSQDVDIPFEAIDRILDCVEEIDLLILTGGEPLLNLPAIEYTIQEIIKRNIAVRCLELTTNGTIQDEKAVEILRLASQELVLAYYRGTGHLVSPKTLFDTENMMYVSFQISADKWHDVQKSYETYYYNKDAFKKDLVTVQAHTKANDTIDYIGRAKTIPHETGEKVKSSRCRLNIKHRQGSNDYILCALSLTAKGSIVNKCNDVIAEYSAEDEPENIIGNIMNESLDQMIDRWQQEHMMTCIEEEKLNDCKTAILNGTGTADQEAYVETLDHVLFARKLHLDRMPDLQKIPFDIFRVFLKDDGKYHFNDAESYLNVKKLVSGIEPYKMPELTEYFRQYDDNEITRDELIQSVNNLVDRKESIKDICTEFVEDVKDFILYINAKMHPEMKPEYRESLNAWIELTARLKIASEKISTARIEESYKKIYNELRK